MGNMVQSNSIGAAFSEVFQARGINIPPIAIGLLLAAAGFVFLGGTQRLASVVEKIVPIMAGVYILGSIILITMHITEVPNALKMILVGAFQPKAIVGGATGITVREAIRYGVARDLFSNEAGMGSTPHAHARASAENPHKQGLAAMISYCIKFNCIFCIDNRCNEQRKRWHCIDTDSIYHWFWKFWRYFYRHLFIILCLLYNFRMAFLW